VARIHLAWELGYGLGHVAVLAPLARELQARGHEVTMSMRDLVGPRALWLPLDVACLQAPVFQHRTVGAPRMSASLAEIALAFGWLDADVLDALYEGWRALLRCVDAEAVVGDYAPTAMLAARSLRLPSLSIGAPFWVPPHDRPLPAVLPPASIAAGRLEAAEARMIHSANHALRASGARRVELACELFRGDRALVCGAPEVDCYSRGALPDGERWHGVVSAPVEHAVPPAWPAGAGPRVFAYLHGRQRAAVDVLRELAARGCRVLCHLPGAAAGPPLDDPAIAYTERLVDLEAAFADAALCVCHAGIGTIDRALRAGVPLLLLPMQIEQELNAAAVERAGAGVALPLSATPPAIAAGVARALDDPTLRARAREYAARHADLTPERQMAGLGDAIERALDA
jgi:UDP:flavonoid glycosyltransferase YjiC (YdhE family)